MPDKSDEVKRYKSTVDRIIEKWQNETQLKLSKDLDPIAKELAELAKNKKPSAEDKKQMLDLNKAAREAAAKVIKASSGNLDRQLKQVKPPDLEKQRDVGSVQEKLDDLQDQMDQFHKELKDDGVELKFDPRLKAKLPFLEDDVKVTVDADKKGVNSVKANVTLFKF
jgi:small-conductance mechanosensitive channel